MRTETSSGDALLLLKHYPIVIIWKHVKRGFMFRHPAGQWNQVLGYLFPIQGYHYDRKQCFHDAKPKKQFRNRMRQAKDLFDSEEWMNPEIIFISGPFKIIV
jgi:hypothetical protein